MNHKQYKHIFIIAPTHEVFARFLTTIPLTYDRIPSYVNVNNIEPYLVGVRDSLIICVECPHMPVAPHRVVNNTILETRFTHG